MDTKVDISKTKAFKTPEDFYQWLATNHNDCEQLWVKIYKKASNQQSVTWLEAVKMALCWGWIDGIKKSYDQQFYLQRFTPRRATSNWSQRNTEYVEQLTKDNLMREPGIAQVQAAKADGRWQNAYPPVSEMTVPQDFLKAVEQIPIANKFFKTLNKSAKYTISCGLLTAKKPETRQRRFDKFLTQLKNQEKPK